MYRTTIRPALPALALACCFSVSQAAPSPGGACTDPVSYCTTSPNSVGSGAVISWTGTPSPAVNDFHFLASGCPPNRPLLFFYGGGAASLPFGNGVRCVASNGIGSFRFQPMQIDGSGNASMKLDFSQGPAGGAGAGSWTPGDTWYCQGWFRDPAAGGAAFNLTDGLKVDVCAGDPYPGTVLVPGGSYEMGRHSGIGSPSELPVHPVTVDAFFMDVFEVSNEKYADFLTTAFTQGRVTVSGMVVYQVGLGGEALCDTVHQFGASRITWNGSGFGVLPGEKDHPMLDLSWYGAALYANGRSRELGLTPCYNEADWTCNFSADGFRLPTEAEWEYASRGGKHNPYTLYPWGNSIAGWTSNFLNSGDPYEAGGFPETTPVGYYDGNQIPSGGDVANGYGLYDMSGNLSEWCNDWHSFVYYASSPVDNPQGPSSGAERSVRGGSWGSSQAVQRSAVRNRGLPTARDAYVGFRVLAVRPQ